ncbi:protein phosphatase [bacterium]|nr:protein phosphatase [bacterium]
MIIATASLVAPIGPAEIAMHEVIPRQLWIGNASDARRPADLLQVGIRAVVDLAYEEPPPALPREPILIRVPLTDGEGNSAESLELAIGSVERLLRSAVPTLVACSAGLSRSPLIAAAAVSRVEQTPLHGTLQRIHDQRPLDVSPGLLCEFEALRQS